MRLLGIVRQLVRDLRAQKLRTFLTTFGIVWGTVAVSLLLAFGDGLHRQMIKNMSGMGSGIVIGWPSMTSLPYQGLGKGRSIRLNEDDVTLIRQRATRVGYLSSEYMQSLRLQLGPKNLTIDVSGVHPEFGEMRNLIPAAGGRFLNPIDQRRQRRVAFLGDELATQLFGGADAVGQEFRLHGSPFTVVGVMQRKVQQSDYSGRDKDKLFVPASTMRALTGQEYMDNLIFSARDVTASQAATDEVLGIVAARHRFDPADKEAMFFWDTTEMTRFFDTFMLAFRLFLSIVGSLTLVVGGIGVSNIMNVVVEERSREIGIKLALGARPRGILGQFLMETLVITGAGGLIGLALAHAICLAVPAFGATDVIGTPQVSATVAGVTASLLGLIGLIAGYFPARTAAGLDPVVAIKL